MALLVTLLAAPAMADTALPVLPADDDRVMAEVASPAAPSGLAAIVQMVAALPEEQVDAEADCLATAIWFESRGEVVEGKLAVAQAVLNRVRSGRWGNSICAVIRAPHQFSFAADRVRRDTASFADAMAVAQVALKGLWHDVAEGAHSFHAARINPGWRLTRVARIGNHIFYR